MSNSTLDHNLDVDDDPEDSTIAPPDERGETVEDKELATSGQPLRHQRRLAVLVTSVVAVVIVIATAVFTWLAWLLSRRQHHGQAAGPAGWGRFQARNGSLRPGRRWR